jgi:hypothetical protein
MRKKKKRRTHKSSLLIQPTYKTKVTKKEAKEGKRIPRKCLSNANHIIIVL